VIVLGIAGRMPFAGMAFQALHYLEGFRRLGCEVLYLEESGDWPYDPRAQLITSDVSYATEFIAGFTGRINVPWAYRGPTGGLWGLTEAELRDALNMADAILNLTAGTVLNDVHLAVPVRIYLETDPVKPEIELAKGDAKAAALLNAHTHHFTFGENVGTDRSPIPVSSIRYHPTRQPIVVDWWTPGAFVPPAPDAAFTTIGNWRQTGKDIEWQGEHYAWSKHFEFLRFLELPKRSGATFDLALSALSDDDRSTLLEHAWHIRDALPLSLELDPYRRFIQSSLGEFTVAKEQNIRLRSGAFSDRSASYLAAGRSVITQDTAFGDIVPVGEGLFPFLTMEDILAAVDAVRSDPARHGRAALEIAREYFEAERVVANILDVVGL
jgi:hypothetical protein